MPDDSSIRRYRSQKLAGQPWSTPTPAPAPQPRPRRERSGAASAQAAAPTPNTAAAQKEDMKLKKARDKYGDSAGKLGDVSRQLSFAGIAIVWLFRVGTKLEAEWIPVLALLTLSLTADVSQYLWQSSAWGYFSWSQERRLRKHIGVTADDTDDEEVGLVPPSYNIVASSLVFIKAALMLGAYIWLLAILATRLF